MHVTCSNARLSLVAASLLALAGPAQAQSSLSGSTPVFDSEVKQKAEQAEA